MDCAPVELHDHPLRSPEAVDLIPAAGDEEIGIELGALDPSLAQEPLESRLQPAPDPHALGPKVIHDCPERDVARAVRVALEKL
jgi:hypothetical protein